MKINEDDDIVSHFNRFIQCVFELLRVDVKIKEEDRTMILLSSFPESGGSLVSSLVKGNKKLIVGEVLMAFLKIGNKMQQGSYVYGDYLTIISNSKASSWKM